MRKPPAWGLFFVWRKVKSAGKSKSKEPVLRKTVKLFRLGLRPLPHGQTFGAFDFPAKSKTGVG